MAISPKEIATVTHEQAKLTDSCSYLQADPIHIKLLEEAVRGLDDVNSGRVISPAKLKALYRR